MSLTQTLARALRGSFISAFRHYPSHPKLSRAMRPVVDQLERRVLLSASPLASYHFDEGSGTTAADSSGNGNTATLFGTASFEHYDVGMTTGAPGSDLATRRLRRCGPWQSLAAEHHRPDHDRRVGEDQRR